MHIRRQFLAAGLLLAISQAASFRALHLVVPAQAQAPSSPAASAGHAVYLPMAANSAVHDLAVGEVQLVQGVTLADPYTVHVAGRPALLRVFVTLTGADRLDGVEARLRRYVDGELHEELTAGAMTVYALSSPSDLSRSFNFELPAGWLSPNSAYTVELDSADAHPETNESNNRYPTAGTQPFNLISVPDLEVVIVPVTYKGVTPPVDDLSYLTWMPERVLPVSQINYMVRATPFEYSGDLRSSTGWVALLAAIDAIRAAEDPSWNKVYYGLVDSVAAEGGCPWPCYTGMGYVNSAGRTVYKTSVGFAGFKGDRHAASLTFTHELGHNFGRRHAPCAGPSNVDLAYPYASGAIGQWGYDLTTHALVAPGFKDYMSYCGPEWTSDYTYHGIAQAWEWLNPPAASAPAASDEALVISGYLGPDGRLRVDPVFRSAAPVVALSAAPTHRLDLLDVKGQVLATVPFELSETILDVDTDAEHTDAAPEVPRTASFRVRVEPLADLAGVRLYAGETLLYEHLASGAAPMLAASAPTLSRASHGSLSVTPPSATAPASHYRVRFSPDGGSTWHLLVLDAPTPKVDVPAALLSTAAAPLLEVQVSDGVRIDVQLYPLNVP